MPSTIDRGAFRREYGLEDTLRCIEPVSVAHFARGGIDVTRVDPAGTPRGTIVVADDDEATRLLLCQILRRAAFRVSAFENGRLACDAVMANPPDVVLLDWVMPVMDGPAAVEILKADSATRGIPIVMLTTQHQIEERVIALEAGVQDFLTKPCDARELVARIEQQMRWRRTLATDANTAFMADRLKLYRPPEQGSAGAQEPAGSGSFFDRIWGSEPQKPRKKFG